jgi:hypothetical protein
MARNFPPLLIGLVLGVLVTCGFTHHSQPNWEYKTIWMASPGDTQPAYVADLNNMGKQGWQVVGALPGRGNGEGELILEREK